MSSSENESQTEENSSDEKQENAYDGMNELMGNLAPYDYEPELTISSSSEETESSENETSSNDATSENENDQLGRVGNKDWCQCSQCKREIQEIDSLCCTEVPAIMEDKFEGKKYITLAHEFELLCLNKTILKNVLVGLHETRRDPLENYKDLQNRSLRFAAYKQFIWWIFQHLGKGNRRVIPSCVVSRPTRKLPEADGQYTQFKGGERD